MKRVLKFILFSFCVGSFSAVAFSGDHFQSEWNDNPTCLADLEDAVAFGDQSYIETNFAQCVQAADEYRANGSLLGVAVQYDNVEAAKYFLGLNFSISKLHDRLPLVYLTFSIKMADLLIGFGVDLEPESPTHTTAVFELSRYRNAGLVAHLINQGLKVTSEDLLRVLDYDGDDRVLESILKSRPTLFAGATKVFRSLDLYSLEGQSLALRFIEKGANLMDARTFAGRVPNGRLLIDAYVDHYVKDDFRSLNGGLSAIKFLLENGSNPNAVSSTGYLVASWAMTRKSAKSLEILELFLSAGFEVDQPSSSNYGKTFLMDIASAYQPTGEYEDYWVDILDAVALQDTEFNGQDSKYYRTALHWAIKYQNVAIAFLLAEKTDLSIQDSDGRTPLDFAKDLFREVPADRQKQDLVKIIRKLKSVDDSNGID